MIISEFLRMRRQEKGLTRDDVSKNFQFKNSPNDAVITVDVSMLETTPCFGFKSNLDHVLSAIHSEDETAHISENNLISSLARAYDISEDEIEDVLFHPDYRNPIDFIDLLVDSSIIAYDLKKICLDEKALFYMGLEELINKDPSEALADKILDNNYSNQNTCFNPMDVFNILNAKETINKTNYFKKPLVEFLTDNPYIIEKQNGQFKVKDLSVDDFIKLLMYLRPLRPKNSSPGHYAHSDVAVSIYERLEQIKFLLFQILENSIKTGYEKFAVSKDSGYGSEIAIGDARCMSAYPYAEKAGYITDSRELNEDGGETTFVCLTDKGFRLINFFKEFSRFF